MKIQRNCLHRTIKKINEWWNEDLFVINIGIFEITVDNCWFNKFNVKQDING